MQLESQPVAVSTTIKLPSFLSGLESLRDLYAAVSHRFGSFEKYIESLPDSNEKHKAQSLLELSASLSGLIPENEKFLCGLLGQTTNSLHLPPRPENILLAARQREACPIDLDKVVIIPKLSKLEYYRRQKNFTFEQAVEELSKECGNISALLDANRDLEKAKDSLSQFFRVDQIKDLSELDPETVAGASLIIALGGDDHFCAVAQKIKSDTPVLGLRADQYSVGALLAYELKDLGSTVKSLDTADYSFEAWVKLKVSVNGQELPSALSTIFVGDKHSQYTSRTSTIVQDANGNTILDLGQQRSSGLLIFTGTGSTGWARSASLYLYPEGHIFSRDARYAEFVVREPTVIRQKGDHDASNLTIQNSHFILHEGEKIVIKSLNKDGGILNADSEHVSFCRGAEAIVQIDPEPIWIVVPKKMNDNLSWIYNDFPNPNDGLVTRSQKDKSYPERFSAGNRIDWHREFRGYASEHFEHPKLATAVYAEPADIPREEFQRRLAAGEMKSFVGPLELDPESGQPLNPIGRTGISGRGVLGKFGPNFAADPVVIFKNQKTGNYSLLVIERKDGGWALPGGMVDKGEKVEDALFRELEEETGASRAALQDYLIKDWGLDIYADDRRSTDNAWMETSARLLYVPELVAKQLDLAAGDDAKDLKWIELNEGSVKELYGSHAYIVVDALRYLEKL